MCTCMSAIFVEFYSQAIMDGFFILKCLKKGFDVLILNTISKFSKTKNLTKKDTLKFQKIKNIYKEASNQNFLENRPPQKWDF